MRRLLLLRHAKSAWGDPAIADFDRPLNRRGIFVAPLIGEYIKANKLLPDYTLISPARRTRDTWQLLAGTWSAPRHGFDERIYEAEETTLLSIIKALPAQIESLLLIGHNPGLQDLATTLPQDKRSKLARSIEEKFPTAALCVLDFAVDGWSDVRPGQAAIERFVTPRGLGFMLPGD